MILDGIGRVSVGYRSGVGRVSIGYRSGIARAAVGIGRVSVGLKLEFQLHLHRQLGGWFRLVYGLRPLACKSGSICVQIWFHLRANLVHLRANRFHLRANPFHLRAKEPRRKHYPCSVSCVYVQIWFHLRAKMVPFTCKSVPFTCKSVPFACKSGTIWG